jgi:hypothetical protein
MKINMTAIKSVLIIAFVAVAFAQPKNAKLPGVGWSSATAISPVLQPDPTRGAQLNDVAVNANGLAIAAWDQYTYNTGGPYTIGAAVQSGGRWGAPFTVSGTIGFSMNPKVAIGADGTMAVSWVYEDPILNSQKVQVAVKPPATTWTTTTLAQGPVGGVAITGFVPVGIDANGNVTAAWTMWDGTRHVVQAATLPKGRVWQAAVKLSGATTDGLYLSLAVNARGDAAVAYTVSPYTYPTATFAEYVFRSGPGGTWTLPVMVSEMIPSTVGYVTSPQVALDASGLATVIYFAYGVEANRQLKNGNWSGPTKVLAAANQVSSYISPDLAVDDNGNAVAAVSIFDATVGVDRASVWVARGTPDGLWSPQQRLTDPAVPVDAYATRVAMSPDGTLAMVGWIDHYHGTVQVSKLAGGIWGAADTIGRGTAWSSFQEILGLRAGAGNVARAIWKSTKSGTQIMASSYGK